MEDLYQHPAPSKAERISSQEMTEVEEGVKDQH